MIQKETKRSLKTAQTRENIIESARKLMRLYGYESTSIQQICQEAGVSIGTFYHLFPSKHDLLSSLTIEITEVHDAHEDFNFETDSPYKIAENWAKHSREIASLLDSGTLYDVFFHSPSGNKLFYSKEHPTYRYTTEALKGFQSCGKLCSEMDIDKVYLSLLSCHLGVIYTSHVTGKMEFMMDGMNDILKRIISTYLTPEYRESLSE